MVKVARAVAVSMNRVPFRCHRHTRVFSSAPEDTSISILDIVVDKSPVGSNRPDLVPFLDFELFNSLPKPYVATLRWMLQKDLVLRQDFCLLGHSAADRRLLAFCYAALTSREVEYVAVSRETSDADLKQRKVIEQGASEYVDQGPVRAARNGRLLILDGIEKAERNVLPTLNNLLENRSLSLDDGSLMVSAETFQGHQHDDSSVALHKVHDDFRVLALGAIDQASGLDPPLRSRFQAQSVEPLNAGETLDSLAKTVDSNKVQLGQLEALVSDSTTSSLFSCFSSLRSSALYMQRNPSFTVEAVIRGASGEGMLAKDRNINANEKANAKNSASSSFIMTKSLRSVTQLLEDGISARHGVALVGPKGCGKSSLVKNFASESAKETHLYSLVSDVTPRDLFLRRTTDHMGDTIWIPTALTRAIEGGGWVILDGIDKIHTDTLTALGQLMQFGQVDLPDGRRLTAGEGFACIALAHPPSSNSWITSEVASMFHWVEMHHLESAELQHVLLKQFPFLTSKQVDQLVRCRDQLALAVQSGAADSKKGEETISLSLRKLKHICLRLRRDVHDLSTLVADALMIELMPEREKDIVLDCMRKSGMTVKKGKKKDARAPLDENLLEKCRRTSTSTLLVPRPRFEMNPSHQQSLNSLLEAHAVGERALLIMGYQGVGKNKVVDHLLSLLDCEKEYVQLHRDTTVQSMLSTPTVQNGRIVHQDSPLVRAAVSGRILVVDEADKAPVEVVALLKGLIEDGELTLPDGKILRYESDGNENTVVVHDDFRLWALANPSGYPFHGNDLAKEMSDIFSCHTISPLDSASQYKILRSYGPNVADEIISRVVAIWDELRAAHEKGMLNYPFSVREAVSVIKHLDEFPRDGIASAVNNVVAFDKSDQALMNLLGSIFSGHGVDIGSSTDSVLSSADALGGISTPRTRAGDPKHGKVDPGNVPHVGGNTWYGGTGGSDTAGLGGRGGPYRVDLGHPIHQISDEMKAEVTEEAIQKARTIAAEELAKKLEALKMGEYDWERYNGLRSRVELQIRQLQTHLADVRLRSDQRVWLKRQTSGELDDARLCETLAGERDVFKRRGLSSDVHFASREKPSALRIKLVVDISASMFRFNSFDGRLERLLESTLMIMESMKDDDRFELEITGHNGSDPSIPLLSASVALDEAYQLRILQGMIAHTQYTYAGDQTLEAIEGVMSRATDDDLVIIVSDANLRRYQIDPIEVAGLLKKPGVHSHLILISSLGQEAFDIAQQVPNGRAQVCLDSSELPLMLKQIISGAVSE